MIFKVKKLTLVLGSALALGGCASYYKGDLLADINIKPVMQVQHSSSSPKIMYLLGRYHQGKINYKKAIEAYEKALVANPDYVEVHNGLGVIYSIQGRHELAVQHFQKAISLAPEATYLHNNLGYAYLVQGQEIEAAKSLQLALKLDPGNKQARSNLATTFERVGLHDNVAILRLAAPEAVKPSVKLTASSRNTMAANVTDTANNETTAKLKQVSPNVYEYESIKQDPLLALLSEQTPMLSKDVRIEVSNGNGVTGMAKKVSNFFQKNGFSKARLTNHQTFTQPQTTIYYQSGNQEQANQINQMLPKQVNVLENNNLHANVQVKVLLGQDISHQVAYFNKKDSVKVAVRR
ncbi:MAG: tetratricopeptide repeat protein [Nitrosomonas sp.]|nr:tetratricopeptide repeat protein [Nitrosomonas sp.]